MDEFAPQDPLGILSPPAAQEQPATNSQVQQPAGQQEAASAGLGAPTVDDRRTAPGLSDAENPPRAPTNRSSSIRDGIIASSKALGVHPVDLATAISYETAGTFDPTKRGPTTQWGQHQGLLQFGKPQAAKYGVDWNDPIGSQLGENGAVVRYLKDTGVKPGMGLLDIYSAINAGGVGRYNRSDANNGGAPGTVADKVNNQMSGHRAKAIALLGGGYDVPTTSGGQVSTKSPSTAPNSAVNSVPHIASSRQDQRPKDRFSDDGSGEGDKGTALGLLAQVSKQPQSAPGLNPGTARPQSASPNAMSLAGDAEVAIEIADIDQKIADLQRTAHSSPESAALLSALHQRRTSLQLAS